MKKNDRKEALNTLIIVFKQKIPLGTLTTNLTPFSRELCYGVCRHYFRLEAIANSLLTKKPKGLDIWICLLMGLYQLHFQTRPDYAVVQETVALLSGKQAWAKSLLNAVLRNYCRNKDNLIENIQNQPAYLYGHPSWLIQRIQTAWPKHWEAILKANDEHPPMSLRINIQKTNISQYLEHLKNIDNLGHPHPHAKQAILLDKPCDVYLLPGTSAQLAASLLNLSPGLRVLDACSAPGGKTCHLLETEPNLKICVAVDIDDKRLSRVQENLTRLHLEATLLLGDAANPEHWWDGQLFDRILLDAPCSATGVIRRHPDIKYLRTEAEVSRISQTQSKLLNALWELLAPGGRLVYATCSILPEENELQLEQFINNHADCIVYHPSQPWGHPTPHGWQILPGEDDMDGFFYGVLEKKP